MLTDPAVRREGRLVLGGEREFAHDVWRQLCELGVAGIGISEEDGGVGLGILELCVVAEELGREIVAVPFLTSRALAVQALLEGGGAHVRIWLPALAAGTMVACYASPRTSVISVDLRDERISGQVMPIIDAGAARVLVLAIKDGDQDRLIAVDLEQVGVRRDRLDSIDPTRPASRIEFSEATMVPLCDGRAAAIAILRAELVGATIAAFEQLGGADRALELATEYALTRRTFGRPIGSYQAIKHKLAQIHVSRTLARGHAYHAAWAADLNGDEAERIIAGARVACSEAFALASQETIHVHGGTGFTWESDCHLYYRRARLLALCLGSVHCWRDRLVTLLADDAGEAY